MKFVFGISSRACVDKKTQRVSFKKTDFSVACGNVCQSPLTQSGDRTMIDWGYLHICDKDARVIRIIDKDQIEILPTNNTYDGYDDGAILASIRNELQGVVTVAYDEIKPIEYFGDQLNECYTEQFDCFGDMIKAAIREYPEIKGLCDEFDANYVEHFKIIQASVTSARELSSDEKQRLNEKLEKKFSQSVECTYAVDEKLLAGIRVQVKDIVYDNTAINRLTKMKDSIMG